MAEVALIILIGVWINGLILAWLRGPATFIAWLIGSAIIVAVTALLVATKDGRTRKW